MTLPALILYSSKLPSLEEVNLLLARNIPFEFICESRTVDEYMSWEAPGFLVHWVHSTTRIRTWSSFECRAQRKAFELKHLWGRSTARLQAFTDFDVSTSLDGAKTESLTQSIHSLDVICCSFGRTDELVNTLNGLFSECEALTQAGIQTRIHVIYQEPSLLSFLTQNAPECLSNAFCNFVYSEPGLTRARNVGINQSNADVVVFIDDDVVIHPGLLREYKSAAEKFPSAIGFAGRVVSRIQGERESDKPSVGQIRPSGHVDTHFDSTTNEPVVVHTPLGANMAYRRERMNALLGTHWFDAQLEGSAHREETTLAIRLFRLGEHLQYVPRASLLHLEATRGGCENRAMKAYSQKVKHRTLEYLFLNRLYAPLGPLGRNAMGWFTWGRDIRSAPTFKRKLGQIILGLHAKHLGRKKFAALKSPLP